MKLFKDLNPDQLKGLSNLCFDLAKLAFAASFFPVIQPEEHIFIQVLKIALAVLSGLAFTYIAVVLLKDRRR